MCCPFKDAGCRFKVNISSLFLHSFWRLFPLYVPRLFMHYIVKEFIYKLHLLKSYQVDNEKDFTQLLLAKFCHASGNSTVPVTCPSEIMLNT
jgi:hypothetical protein